MAGPVSFPGGDPFRRLARLERAVLAGVEDAVTEHCLLVKADAQERLTELGRVDRGTLRNSIEIAVTAAPGLIEGVVYETTGYGRWVEFGRKGVKSSPPGTGRNSAKAAWPPVPSILAWVRRNFRRLAPAGRTKSGRARIPRGDKRAKAERSFAFLVGRKIYERGIPPSPFMIPAFNRFRRTFRTRVVRHVQRRKAEAV